MTLFFFLAACAHSSSLHKGDEAAANNNWTAAYDAYASALQAKPSSSAAKEAVNHAKPLAVAMELQSAQLALDVSNYEEALGHLDYVRKVDPSNEEEKQLRDDAKKRMAQELTGKLGYELDATAIYDLVERARKLFPDLVEIPKTLEALRTRIEKDAETLAAQRKYKEAIASLRMVAEHEPNLKVHVQTLEQTYLTAWADDYAARARAAAAKKQEGLAATLFARAYEIAGRPDDLERSRSASKALVKKATLGIYLETKGEGGARNGQIRAATQTLLDGMPAVSKAYSTTNDLMVEINVRAAKCTETSESTPESKDYVSGQIKVPNPEHDTLTAQLAVAQSTFDRAQADLDRVKPDATAARTGLNEFDTKLAKAKSERDAAKGKADSARAQLEGSNKRKADLEAKLATLQSNGGPEWDMKATQSELDQVNKVIPQWEEAFREKQSIYEQANLKYDAIETDRAPAAEASQRLEQSQAEATKQVADAKAALTALQSKLAATPSTLLQDVHETLEYKLYKWTRTCSAPVSVVLRPKFKTELPKYYTFSAKQTTTDTSNIGHAKAAVVEDKKEYPKTDVQLVADADAESMKLVNGAVSSVIESYFTNQLSNAAGRVETDPDLATDALVTMYIGARQRVDEAAQAILKSHLEKNYGLTKLDLLKAE
jgi:chromosome segregation ATPase